VVLFLPRGNFTTTNPKSQPLIFATHVLTGHPYKVYRVIEIKGQVGFGKMVIELDLTGNILF
jgi:hypothetical protein